VLESFAVLDQQLQPVSGASVVSAALGRNVASGYAPTAAIPEPASWLMMLAGFALTGQMVRRRQRRHA